MNPYEKVPRAGNLAEKNSLGRKVSFQQVPSRQGLYKIFSVSDPINSIKSMISCKNGVYAKFTVNQTPFFLKSGVFCMKKHA